MSVEQFAQDERVYRTFDRKTNIANNEKLQMKQYTLPTT